MLPSVVFAPAAEPIHLDEAKIALRVTDSEEDSFITGRIRMARQLVEESTGRALVSQTRELALPAFPNNPDLDRISEPRTRIKLRGKPLRSIESITYIDEDGAEQTLDSSSYQVDTANGWVQPAYDESWPATREVPNAVRVRYLCGAATHVTANNSTNQLTAKGRTFADGDHFRLWNSGGALPAGLEAYVDYYVVNASGSTFQVALTEGGSAVEFTDNGTGSTFAGEVDDRALQAMHLAAANFYENREPVVVGTIATKMPMSIRSLLLSLRV
ncbi:MAG: phage head-tail connector protein [bacterium]|nr:phage head-tail connector protein [bacterium]